MYFTKIRLSGSIDIDLPIIGASVVDPFVLKDTDGLTPPDIDLFFSNSANQGGNYQGRRPQQREIVLKIGLNPDYSVGQTPSDLREMLYDFLSTETGLVVVKIMNGTTVLMTADSHVKRLAAVPFSKDPEVQLTLDCVQSYFVSELVHADNTDSTLMTIDNVGSAPSGFYFMVQFTSGPSNWFIQDNYTAKRLSFFYNFLPDDYLEIDTQPGQRKAVLYRDVNTISMLPYLYNNPVWFQMKKGVNLFTPSDSNFTYIDVSFTPKYWGV